MANTGPNTNTGKVVEGLEFGCSEGDREGWIWQRQHLNASGCRRLQSTLLDLYIIIYHSMSFYILHIFLSCVIFNRMHISFLL